MPKIKTRRAAAWQNALNPLQVRSTHETVQEPYIWKAKLQTERNLSGAVSYSAAVHDPMSFLQMCPFI